MESIRASERLLKVKQVDQVIPEFVNTVVKSFLSSGLIRFWSCGVAGLRKRATALMRVYATNRSVVPAKHRDKAEHFGADHSPGLPIDLEENDEVTKAHQSSRIAKVYGIILAV